MFYGFRIAYVNFQIKITIRHQKQVLQSKLNFSALKSFFAGVRNFLITASTKYQENECTAEIFFAERS